MDPLVADGETFGAALPVGRDALDRVPMRAADGAGLEGGRASMLGHQAKSEARASAGRRLEDDRAAMLLGDVLHDGEPEA